MNRQVIKRDGRIKDYDRTRVYDALQMAYEDLYSEHFEEGSIIPDKLLNDYESICMTFDSVVESMNEPLMSVEEIQDILVRCIEEFDRDLAVAYSDYRNERTKTRQADYHLLKSVKDIIATTNEDVFKENANKKATLSSTQRDLIAGEVSKEIARGLIPARLMEAHDSGIIKIHDLDYYMQGITNCELVNLKDMFENGTVINGKKIHTPHSIKTAMTLATQIAAQVSSSTYGGQTMSLSHLAPYVRASKEYLINKWGNRCVKLGIDPDTVSEWILNDLKKEIRDAVQTFNYQINTIMTTNGQTPFISLAMYIDEEPEYAIETAMLIEEFLEQRLEGIENEYGVKTTQTFPKLLYFLDENNTYEGSKYFYLTALAAKCTSVRMNPDYISVKKMKEVIGHAFPCMGCRAFLSPFKDENGDFIFYGRGNLGVTSINLPYLALEAEGNILKFFEYLNGVFDMCVEMCELRYSKLKGVKAKTAPILWQHGALARLNPEDCITKAIDGKGFTVTIGYSGLYETVKALMGESHTDEIGFQLADMIMQHLKNRCDEVKVDMPHLRVALYGTPQESTTGWFDKALKKRFGIIKDITDKGWITNSYHVDIREEIDAFSKLTFESKLQKYSTGGAVSYVETYNMQKNPEAVLQLIQHMYETIMYAEINFESDVCGECHYNGVMSNDSKTLNWVCPQCGNDNQETLSVVRRTCGYLGETTWTDGRKLDILNRVKHL